VKEVGREVHMKVFPTVLHFVDVTTLGQFLINFLFNKWV